MRNTACLQGVVVKYTTTFASTYEKPDLTWRAVRVLSYPHAHAIHQQITSAPIPKDNREIGVRQRRHALTGSSTRIRFARRISTLILNLRRRTQQLRTITNHKNRRLGIPRLLRVGCSCPSGKSTPRASHQWQLISPASRPGCRHHKARRRFEHEPGAVGDLLVVIFLGLVGLVTVYDSSLSAVRPASSTR